MVCSTLIGTLVPGLIEMTALKTLSRYEMLVTLKNGERVVFTSTEHADIETLALRLAAMQGQKA